jgi:hypothetical protein
MIQQLKGKIFWVLDDFAYIGEKVSKKDSTTHTVARLDHVVIDGHMIKFYVCPFKNSDNEEWSYNVNLLINEVGTRFSGIFSEATEPSHNGELNCELFSNDKKYMIYGRWVESEIIYTFWAIIDKE